ncbi:DUF2163 domain-containing protein [Paraburkholderia panacisoli]|uniref:DUF2163 domain-containing protein n=1 Tax=Paraburkholderia panacisoli TaxID=2603818 RepID=A0A5B0HL76_9BURK|nr:DUF2163 domain-containing protein [Paraburkholderia panacisoli]KAA1015979.1 DUF2163 domain-containing protein [Paraburkholderia panacisoli]
MRTIPAALAAHLAGDVRTVCTLWLVTRTDGALIGFTDFDQDITYGGQLFRSAGGYTHSQIQSGSDLSTSNLEVDAIFDSDLITPQSLESGLWDFASVVISLVNYNDLTMGAAVLASGVLGQVTIRNGVYKTELRGLAQLMQEDFGDVYSPTCRAMFGDAQCTTDLTPLTFSGSIQSVTGATQWADATLTQTGPNASFADTVGHRIPTMFPYTVQIVPPTGGAFVATGTVKDSSGAVYSQGTPGPGVFSVSPTGLYTFDITAAGGEIFIDFSYQIGYFAYGKVVFTSGQNAGFEMDVKAFAPGHVTLAMAMPYPLAVGDTYTIVAGCDKLFGTCRDRWNNVIHFRGEPYIPGQDVILRPQG